MNLPLSKKEIETCQNDLHHVRVDSRQSSRSFLHNFIEAEAQVEKWDLLVDAVILNPKREDVLIKGLRDYYDADQKKVSYIPVKFSDEINESEILLVSKIPHGNYDGFPSGYVSATLDVLNEDEWMVKDIIL